MTELEKISAVSTMAGEPDETVVSTYLKIAGDKVLKKCYPFDPDIKEVPERYASTQVEIAVYMLSKRGAEGQQIHIEGGIHRHYGDSDVPASLLASVVPFAKPF